jgi:hypothetical protein
MEKSPSSSCFAESADKERGILDDNVRSRHVDGIGKTGFYRPTALLVKLYINLAVTIYNHPFFKKTSIFKYFKAFFF